jgi:phospholipid/cholesterol/gamma-HCH transport system ATP-binding protein
MVSTLADAPAIHFDRVTLSRGARVIVREASFALQPGTMTAVLGPSGAGKSTLLYAITGELAPAGGELTVLGERMPRPGANALFALRRRMGVLLQGNGLLSDLDVFENVALPLRHHTTLPEPVLAELVTMKLNAVGLGEAGALMPQELSGGMARRVALARALVLDPPLMLYDEPLTGLDPIAVGVILDLIRRLNDSLGLTSVIITHHVRETLEVADRALVVANQGIVFHGTPAELMQTTDPLLRQFLEGQPDGPIGFDYRRQPAREAGAARG